MVRTLETNLEMIRHVAMRLGDLRNRVVFLGGAATALIITDKATPDVRVTTDVDVIVEIASRTDYYRLSESLRDQGFTENAGKDITRGSKRFPLSNFQGIPAGQGFPQCTAWTSFAGLSEPAEDTALDGKNSGNC